MLCGMISSSNQKVIARHVTKEHGPFHCAGCKHELILRKGKIKVHHFAHKPPFDCVRGKGETEAHRKCKESIYQALSNRSNVSHLDIEVDFGNVVADIYALINNVPVAIEVQRSNISVNEITRRTEEYNRLGVNVLWLALFNEKLNKDKYSPSAWEKWCHAVYFGRVYYWFSELTVVPIHFSDYQLYVEESTWYESGGVERSEGGYFRTSKRYRTPNAGNAIDIATHFSPQQKNSWSGGSVHIPSCRIYLDNQIKWWSKT